MQHGFFRRHRSVLILILVWVVVFSGLRTLQHFSFGTNTYDLAIFDYMMFFTLKGEIMAEPFHGYWGTHFAVHFMPVLFLLVPFYLIFEGPLFLLYVQVLICALSALFLYLIAKKEFAGKYTAFLIALAYLLYRPFLNGVMYDFHPEMFFPLLIFAAYYFAAVRKNTAMYFVSVGLALSLKEDTAIFVFFFGIYLFFKLREKKKTGLITSAAALVYFVVAAGVMIPYFRSRAGLPGRFEFVNLWGDSGDTILDILKIFLAQPLQVIRSIPWSTSLPKLFNLVAPLLFIPFFSWMTLLILPPVMILITSSSPIMQGFGLHYAANIFPFLFLPFVFGLKNIEESLQKKYKKFLKIIPSVVLCVVIINVANTKWNLLWPSRYTLLGEYKDVKQCIDRIPAGASVASLSAIIPHIPKRKNISMLPESGDAEYILVHTGINPWPFSDGEFQDFVENIKVSDDFEALVMTEKILLLKKKPPQH